MRVVKWQGNDGLGLALRSECEDGKTVLVPTHVARRAVIAALQSIGENPSDYAVHVLAPWVKSQWERLGDGTRLIDQDNRMPYLWRAFDNRIASGQVTVLRRSKGSLSLAETVGSRAVPWLPEEGSEKDRALPLTPGQRELVGVAREYARLIKADGLVDVGTVYKELPPLLAGDSIASTGFVLAGFEQMGYVQQTLVSGMDSSVGGLSFLVQARECNLMDVERILRDDRTWDVRHVVRPGSHGFHTTTRARHVLDDLATLGTSIEVVPGCHGTSSDDTGQPICDLVHALFIQDASDGTPCRSLIPPQDGSVSILHVAGTTAEADAIADMAREKATSGDVAVIGPDAYRLWEELVPRLLATRLDALEHEYPPAEVRASVSVPLLSIRTVSVMMAASKQIVMLSGMLSAEQRENLGLEPARTTRHLFSAGEAFRRHEGEPTTAGWFLEMSQDVLGDMSWWPPDEILDLMAEETVGVPVPVVTRLRARWACDRTLSAFDVLSTIMDANQVGAHMACLAKAIANGSMTEALSLVRIYIRRMEANPSDDAHVITRATRSLSGYALGVLAGVTKSVGEPIPGDAESIDRYFTCVSQAASHAKATGELSARPSSAGDDDLRVISLLSLGDVEGIAPRSYDAVIMTAQDSVTSAVARDDSLQSVLMRRLGCAETSENMSNYRSEFMTALSLAKESVVFERVLRKVEGRHVCDTFPSVGLSNVMLAYEEGREGDMLVRDASEIPFVRNFSLDGQEPAMTGEVATSPVGSCDDTLIDLMWASRPRGGEGNDQVMLSASDVDTYAHCGYRWFVERVLGVRSPVESLPSYAYGSFDHSVLEEAHRDMIRDAARQVVEGDGRTYPITPYSEAMASGDRLDRRVGDDGDGMTDGSVPAGYDRGMPGTRIGGNGQIPLDVATEAFCEKTRRLYVSELSGRHRSGAVPMIPHTITEATKADMMAQSIERFPAYETGMFWRERPGKSPSYFVPRFTELRFGEEYGRPVTIAGVPFHGTIDRIDVNSLGECVILDYKHASPEGFSKSHCIDPYGDSNLQLIVYAMAVRQILPNLRIAGLVYVGTRYPYAMSGKLDDGVFDATDAKGINLSADSRLTPADEKARKSLPPDAPATMDDLIDMMAGQVEECVRRMSRGEHPSPSPDGHGQMGQCSFCHAKGLCMRA